MPLQARYFDGRRSVAQPVVLHGTPGWVHVRGENLERREALEAVRIGERLGSAPRRIEFADGAHCEADDGAEFAAFCAQLGYRDGWVDRAQRLGWVAAAALVLVIAAVWAAYRWGLPLATGYIARQLPESLVSHLSEQTLVLLDGRLLGPSDLDPERRQALREGFVDLAGSTRAELLFRAGPDFGANALALPDGRVVLLDELVRAVDGDERVLAVLAHELAHVEHVHGLQAMVRASALGALVAWWIGDFGPLIAGAPVALLQARHSRELEAQADREAARRLCAHGIAPIRLAEALERIGAARAATRHGEAMYTGTPSEAGGRPRGWLGYLDSHPGVAERVEALRGFACRQASGSAPRTRGSASGA